jgi:NADPH-dependent curcumin reductase CurA
MVGPERIAWSKAKARAGYLVRKAVKKGTLVNLKETYIECVDCECRARVYDHRDYSKPLDVEPVCVRCNIARGTNSPNRIPGHLLSMQTCENGWQK